MNFTWEQMVILVAIVGGFLSMAALVWGKFDSLYEHINRLFERTLSKDQSNEITKRLDEADMRLDKRITHIEQTCERRHAPREAE